MRICSCLLHFVLLAPAAWSAQISVEPPSHTEIARYPDLDRSLRPQDLGAVPWQPVGKPVHFARQPGTWWIRLTRAAPSGQALYLYVRHPEIDWITVHTVEGAQGGANARWAVQTLSAQALQAGLRLPQAHGTEPTTYYLHTQVGGLQTLDADLLTESEHAAMFQTDRWILNAVLVFALLASIGAGFRYWHTRRVGYLGLIAINGLFALHGLNTTGLLIELLQLDASAFVRLSSGLMLGGLLALGLSLGRVFRTDRPGRPARRRVEFALWLGLFVLYAFALERGQAVLVAYMSLLGGVLAIGCIGLISWISRRYRPANSPDGTRNFSWVWPLAVGGAWGLLQVLVIKPVPVSYLVMGAWPWLWSLLFMTLLLRDRAALPGQAMYEGTKPHR